MISIALIYYPYMVLIDCGMSTCTCTHVKLNIIIYFIGQILNRRMIYFLEEYLSM